MVSSIFFDLDRTLWDFDFNSQETLLEIYEKYRLTHLGVDSAEEFVSIYKQINSQLWDLYRLNKISQKDLRVERFRQTFEKFDIINPKLSESIGKDYVEICPRKTRLFPYVYETLDYLCLKYKLHIITNGFHETQHIKLKYSNLSVYFENIVTSEEVGEKKPSRKIFEHALCISETTAEESVYVGDDLIVDIIGCQKSNIDGVFFNPTKIKHNENPKFEINCLSDLMKIF